MSEEFEDVEHSSPTFPALWTRGVRQGVGYGQTASKPAQMELAHICSPATRASGDAHASGVQFKMAHSPGIVDP